MFDIMFVCDYFVGQRCCMQNGVSAAFVLLVGGWASVDLQLRRLPDENIFLSRATIDFRIIDTFPKNNSCEDDVIASDFRQHTVLLRKVRQR